MAGRQADGAASSAVAARAVPRAVTVRAAVTAATSVRFMRIRELSSCYRELAADPGRNARPRTDSRWFVDAMLPTDYATWRPSLSGGLGAGPGARAVAATD
nr:hypothetical protein KPHV_04000 [Kitasatospora purpeofusca]